MTDLGPRLSRRKLLEITGLAPLAVLAKSGASYADLGAAATRLVEIPEATMLALLAKADGTKLPYDKDHFRLVVRVLWTYFLKGAEPVEVPDWDAVLKDAFEVPTKHHKSSGYRIVATLSDWDFQGHEPKTNTCAYRCGRHAAEIALKPMPEKKIDKDVYRKAWDETSVEMTGAMDRLRTLAEKAGIKADDSVYALGNGC